MGGEGLFAGLKADCEAEWAHYVGHPFVRAIGDGSLARASFQHYLVQDYLFLIQFARAYALAVYKADTLAEMRTASAGVAAILDVEMDLHVRLCGEWGLTPEILEETPEARATIAYTRFVLDAGLKGDLLDLEVALAPCVVGYAEIARGLAATPGALSPANPYRDWIAEYAGDAYQELAAKAVAALDAAAETRLAEARRPRLTAIFRQATRLEADFWDMGLTLAD